jgi:hypothetical protein
MQFQVPQFIEHEAKVVGPFTIKQALFLGGPLVVGFIVYFSTTNFLITIAVTGLLEGIGIAFNVVKVGRKRLPEILWDALMFGVSSKAYVWKRGKHPIVFRGGTEYVNPLQEQTPESREISHRSKLHNVQLQVETKK